MTDLATAFHDPLVPPGAAGLPERFFDRLMFNAHPVDRTAPSVIVGCGLYPGRDVIDGFAILVTPTEQRNLRWSTELSATRGNGGGPFRFEVAEPNRTWRLSLGDNPSGLVLDLTWRARTRPWVGGVEVANADAATPTSFDHLFQSGLYEGTVSIDGEQTSADGWYGQRDRSRGVRTMSGGQGLHLWFQGQFADVSVGFLLVEDRHGRRVLLDGAVMPAAQPGGEADRLDPVVGVRHDLRFDEGLDLRGGTVEVATASGETYAVQCDASAGGGFMAGGGYGGQHGRRLGRDHLEHDRYPLDGTVSPRTLDTPLTDRLCALRRGTVTGTGIVEFALTRSPSYTYRPTLV